MVCPLTNRLSIADCPHNTEDSDDAWSQLKAFAQNLVTKDPRTLTPHEAALLRILNQRYGVQQEEMNRSRVKRSCSLVDQVMKSPPPVHQTLPPQQPCSIPYSELRDCPHEAKETNFRGEPNVSTDLPVRQPRTNEERIVRYAEDWALLKSGHLVDGNATFDQMPWPAFFNVNRDCLDELTLESIRAFILHPSRLGAKSPQKILNDELLRWHQDKLTVILRKFAPEDRPTILAAGNRIATFLVQLRDTI